MKKLVLRICWACRRMKPDRGHRALSNPLQLLEIIVILNIVFCHIALSNAFQTCEEWRFSSSSCSLSLDFQFDGCLKQHLDGDLCARGNISCHCHCNSCWQIWIEICGPEQAWFQWLADRMLPQCDSDREWVCQRPGTHIMPSQREGKRTSSYKITRFSSCSP